MTDKMELIHTKDYDGNWYWLCPICGKYLAPHNMNNHQEGWKVLQTKGAASRHLMTHDLSLVQHGRKISGSISGKVIIQKLFHDKNKILVDKPEIDGTNIECFCGKIYHSERKLENGEISSCCYCGRAGYYNKGKLAVWYNK